MAGIYPNSDFIICKGVPLEPTYEHTLYQLGLVGQYNSIHQYSKFTLNAQSYQRVNKGSIRVGITADKLYDCNYVMFRNTSYTNTDNTAKWFYAFITSVEYVNDNASDISYQIDVMQTWYFDYTLGKCFVDREHSLTDNFYQSAVEEGLETGELIVRGTVTHQYNMSAGSPYPSYYAVVFYRPNEEYINIKEYTGGAIPTVQNPATYSTYNFHPMPIMTVAVPFQPSSDTDVAQFGLNLQGIVNKVVEISGELVSIQFIPREIVIAYGLNTGALFDFTQEVSPTDFRLPQGTGFFYAGKSTYYVPKNKKLYQYPYSQVVVSNNSGQTNQYKWELFAKDSPSDGVVAKFKLQPVIFPSTQVHLYPYDYRHGISNELGITLENFPQLCWSEDSFQRWWNTNKHTWSVNLLSTIINGGMGAGLSIARNTYVGNKIINKAEQMGNYKLQQVRKLAASGTRLSTAFKAEPYFDTADSARQYMGVANGLQITSAIANVANHLAQYSDAKAVPDGVKGNQQDISIQFEEGRTGFIAYDMAITGEMAEIIDDYFTMFGYAVRKLKIPNIQSATPSNLRPYWNYIKTENCVIHSNNCNADDVKAIEEIYNNGITFWTRPQDVGDYSLNNAPRL